MGDTAGQKGGDAGIIYNAADDDNFDYFRIKWVYLITLISCIDFGIVVIGREQVHVIEGGMIGSTNN